MIKEVIDFLREDFTKKGIPTEVQEVMLFEMYNQYCGIEMYDKITAIKKKYPQYYPWEAKYDKIPQEVHEAYRKEMYGDILSIDTIQCGEGIESLLDESTSVYKPLETQEDFKKMMQEFADNENRQEQERIKELNRKKSIWYKHYKKYNLKFRE